MVDLPKGPAKPAFLETFLAALDGKDDPFFTPWPNLLGLANSAEVSIEAVGNQSDDDVAAKASAVRTVDGNEVTETPDYSDPSAVRLVDGNIVTETSGYPDPSAGRLADFVA
jgi:hypothetical protein